MDNTNRQDAAFESAILVAAVERSFLREERESAGTAKGEKEITRGWCARNKKDNAIGRCKAQRGSVGYGGGASKDYSYSSRTEKLSIFVFSLPL